MDKCVGGLGGIHSMCLCGMRCTYGLLGLFQVKHNVCVCSCILEMGTQYRNLNSKIKCPYGWFAFQRFSQFAFYFIIFLFLFILFLLGLTISCSCYRASISEIDMLVVQSYAFY